MILLLPPYTNTCFATLLTVRLKDLYGSFLEVRASYFSHILVQEQVCNAWTLYVYSTIYGNSTINLQSQSCFSVANDSVISPTLAKCLWAISHSFIGLKFLHGKIWPSPGWSGCASNVPSKLHKRDCRKSPRQYLVCPHVALLMVKVWLEFWAKQQLLATCLICVFSR
jgi:hypothetical protein